MGILLSCLWGARDEEEHESSDKNEGIQVSNVTNRRTQAQSGGFLVQEHTNESDYLLGRKARGPENESGFTNHPQVENDVIAGSAQLQAGLGLSVQDHTNVVRVNANDTQEVADESAKANVGSSVQDRTNKSENHLGGGKIKPDDEQGCKNRSQVKPEVVSESKGSIPHKYKLFNDSELSRDDECPICLEEYDSENPRIIAKCSHHYHLGCIYAWQERSQLCPNCLRVAEFKELE